MKKITILLLILFISLKGFAQKKASKIDIDKAIQLVETKDDTNTYDDLLKSTLKEASNIEQEEFYNKIQLLIKDKKESNTVYFSRKFTQKEIIKICYELSNASLIGYSQRTVSFMMEWRSKRRELCKAYKTIYDSYR